MATNPERFVKLKRFGSDFTIDEALRVLKVAVASTTKKGIAELATAAEAITGSDTERVVTPAALKAALDDYYSQRDRHLTGDAGFNENTSSLVLALNDGSTVSVSMAAVIAAGAAAAQTVPDASTLVRGKIEIATVLEVQTGTDNLRAVTPFGLASAIGNLIPAASETATGAVELATVAETTTGTDTSRAVTPAGVKAAVTAAVSAIPSASAASETVSGIVELATVAEATTGTDTSRAVTPAGVKAVADTLVDLNSAETIAGAKRGAVTAANTGAFDMSASNNFSCVPTGIVTLTPSNLAAAEGQSGYIFFQNSGAFAVSKAATVKSSSTLLTTLSATGTYLVSYFVFGSTMYITGSSALT